MKKLFGLLLTVTLLGSFMNNSFAESYVMHTVKLGDTYWNISHTYREQLTDLYEINNTTTPSLQTGDFIKIKSLNKDIGITVNGQKLQPDSSPYLENNTTFVPVRFIAEALNADITWDGANATAIISDHNTKIALPVGSQQASINGSPYNVMAPIKLHNNRVYVPVRFISESLNCTVSWEQQSYTVHINKNGSTSMMASSYSEEDLYWLSRIVHAESSGESFEGKLAVANVVINRKNSNSFPNTIKGVVFDDLGGIQFTPVSNGTIYNTPNKESVQAATDALEGSNNIGDALFFVNSSKSKLNWIQTHRTYYSTIGNHEFYL